MNEKDFYDERYTKYSQRDLEWRELSGNIKGGNIMNIVGEEKHTSVLDIGAGTGAILCHLSKSGFAEKYYALDISASAIELIKARGDIPNLVEARTFDGLHIPYKDQQFDLAIFSHVIEHLHDPAGLLVEAPQVARYLVIEVPLEDNIYTHIKVDIMKSHYREEIGHIQWFNQRKFSDLLRITCGFNILAMRMVYLPDEVYYFYKGSRINLIYRLLLLFKKTLRSLSPSLYSYLLTDYCIALVSDVHIKSL